MRAFLVAVAVVFSAAPGWAGDVKCLGLDLPDNSRKVKDAPKDECRFISSLSWDETMKFFGRNLSSSTTRWHHEVNIPVAKYRHLENSNAKSTWEGVNVYTLPESPEVRIFVVPRPPEPAPPKDKKASGSKKKGKGR